MGRSPLEASVSNCLPNRRGPQLRRAPEGNVLSGSTKRGVCIRSKRVRDGQTPDRAHTRISPPERASKDGRGVLSMLRHPPRGKGDRKGRAFSDLAVHRDRSSMALDDLGHNVEPHAQARICLLPGVRDAIEALKNLTALLARDTQAMIGYPDRDHLVRGGEFHLDGRCIGRILDGIAQQVGEDLPEPVSIPDQAGLRAPTNQNGMAGAHVLYGVGDLPQQGVEIHSLPDVLQSSCLDLGDIQ